MDGYNQNFPNLNAIKTTYYYDKLQYAAAIFDSLQAEYYYNLFQQTLPQNPVSYSPMEHNSTVKYSLETGFMFHRAGNYEKAKTYYLKAEEFSKSNTYSFGVLQSYWVLTSLGVDYQKWDDVVLYAEKALAHPDVEKFNRISTIKHNLAYAHFGKMEYKKALAGLTKEINGYMAAPQSRLVVCLGWCCGFGRHFLFCPKTPKKSLTFASLQKLCFQFHLTMGLHP